MPAAVRTVYVPRFGSQLSSSQRTEPGPDQSVSSPHSESDKRGKKRSRKRPGEAGRPLLKVKLPRLKSRVLTAEAAKDVRTPSERMLKPSTSENTASALVDGDVFFFSQRPGTQPANEKEKAKLSVLRTISKMLEENRLIRLRLSALSQVI